MRSTLGCVVLILLVTSGFRPAAADFEAGRAAQERGDFAAALEHFQPLARRGDRDALLRLGLLYESGEGVEKDLAEAHKWFVLAWKRGVLPAKRRALALRGKLTAEQREDSRQRVRKWLADFETSVVEEPAGGEAGDTSVFYATVHARTQSPPKNTEIKTLCRARVEDVVVTFVTDASAQVLLVAFTERPLLDPRLDISLRPVLSSPKIRRAPRPTATMNWGYVYDRNADGRVDYMTFLDGPNAVVPDPRPENFEQLVPEARIKDQGGMRTISFMTMSATQLRYVMRHTKQVFWHLGDDNFDGRIDAYVVPTRDTRTAWVDGYMIVRSTEFNEEFSRCVFAPGARGTASASCMHSDAGYGVSGKVLTGLHVVPLDEELPMLSLINQAARKCGLTSRHFRSE